MRIANDAVYGLAGGVWSADLARAIGVAEDSHRPDRDQRWRVQSEAPFGGYKQSGLGRENGRYGFEELLQVKSLQH